MKTRSILMILTVVTLMMSPMVVSAQDVFGVGPGLYPTGGHEPQSVKRLAGWLSAYLELELDEQQLADLDGIIEQQLPPISELSRQMNEARRGFFATIEPGQSNADEVRRFAVTQATLYVEVVTKSANLKADVFGVLNPEQQRRLGEILGLIGPAGGMGSHTAGP